MKSIHLTEEQIQQFALDNSYGDDLITAHASYCPECKARIAAYELLFSSLKQAPPPSFDFSLADLVVTQLPKLQPAPSRDNFFVYAFSLALVALNGTILFYFRSYIGSLFAGITPLLIYLTVTTIITVATILSVEMYNTYKKKMRVLEFY